MEERERPAASRKWPFATVERFAKRLVPSAFACPAITRRSYQLSAIRYT
jgi:hypothetical protein